MALFQELVVLLFSVHGLTHFSFFLFIFKIHFSNCIAHAHHALHSVHNWHEFQENSVIPYRFSLLPYHSQFVLIKASAVINSVRTWHNTMESEGFGGRWAKARILALLLTSHVALRSHLTYIGLSLLLFKNGDKNTYLVILLWALEISI